MTSSFVSVLCVVALCCAAAYGAECHGKPDPDAKQNLNEIYTGPQRFVKETTNASCYSVGEHEDTLYVVHLWGSPYQMGFAHGTLMKNEAMGLVDGVWNYLELQVEQAINGTVHGLQPWFVDLVSELGLEGALEATLEITAPYTPAYFNEEMAGMADATGLPLKKLQWIHMIGELTKGSCSMYGAWGKALADPSGLLQLRALDWDVDGPFKDFPQITVYHPEPNTGNGHDFANIGWTGWIGSITGMSSVKLAISEIGVTFPDASFGRESRFGIPFTYILRDIIQFDKTLADARKRLTDAHRTCDLIFGVGDGKSQEFNGVQYSYSVANFYTDTDNMPYNETWHPRIPDVVYYGMDWLCPGYSEVLARQINANYGKLTPEATIKDITAIAQTGDLHVAIYDLVNDFLYTANARRDGATGPALAYDRAFVKLNMTEVFSTQPPKF